MIVTRRRFIANLATGLLIAPSIVRANSLVPVRSLGEWVCLTPSIETIKDETLLRVMDVEMRGDQMWAFIGKKPNRNVQPMRARSLAQITPERMDGSPMESMLVIQPWQCRDLGREPPPEDLWEVYYGPEEAEID